MKLSPEQESIIENFVLAQGIKIPTLRDDLIDHLCCVVESELGKEKSFEQILNEAVKDLAPDGLQEIQHQTIFLLNSKRIIAMKKVLYFTGFIGSLALTAGVTFKLMHWPWANVLFIIGFLFLLLIFIPLLAIDRYKVSLSKAVSVKTKIIMGAIAAIITGLSGLFKMMHLQGADLLLMLGAFVFAFGFLPFYFFTMYKKSIA
jgi:cation transport ATPase